MWFAGRFRRERHALRAARTPRLREPWLRLAAGACVVGAAGLALSGCKDKVEAPKRADHQAAHNPHYHPDIPRYNNAGSTRPASAPAEEANFLRPTATRFSDLFNAGVIGSPVMFVNTETISIPEILEPIYEDLQRKSRILSDADYTDVVLQQVRQQIDYQVSTLLIYEQAKNNYSNKNIQEALDKQMDVIVREMVTARFDGVYARYESHLRQLDYTPEQMKERLKRETIVREYLRERFKPMLKEPTRRELVKYYEQNLPDFTTTEKAELLLIEIPVQSELKKPLADATDAERRAARARAIARVKRAREEIDSGIDFATVARSYSRGAAASAGGSWGEISPGSLGKRWAKPAQVLFTLKPGQMAEVETDDAAFLVRCGKRTPAHQASFEEAQTRIMSKLIDEQFNRYRSEYIRDLMAKSIITKRPEFAQAVLAVVPKPSRRSEGAASSDPKIGR